jgi:hypothetical protein
VSCPFQCTDWGFNYAQSILSGNNKGYCLYKLDGVGGEKKLGYNHLCDVFAGIYQLTMTNRMAVSPLPVSVTEMCVQFSLACTCAHVCMLLGMYTILYIYIYIYIYRYRERERERETCVQFCLEYI